MTSTNWMTSSMNHWISMIWCLQHANVVLMVLSHRLTMLRLRHQDVGLTIRKRLNRLSLRPPTRMSKLLMDPLKNYQTPMNLQKMHPSLSHPLEYVAVNLIASGRKLLPRIVPSVIIWDCSTKSRSLMIWSKMFWNVLKRKQEMLVCCNLSSCIAWMISPIPALLVVVERCLLVAIMQLDIATNRPITVVMLSTSRL